MRVLLVVSSSRLAGTERHVVELAGGLRAAGVEVEVACEGGGEGLDGVLEGRGVPLHRMPLTGSRLAQSVLPLARLSLGFDLVHAHLTHATAAAVAARAVAGRPVVETRHFVTLAHEQRGPARRLVGRSRRSLLDRSLDLTIAPSASVARHVRGPSVVVPHGIPMPPRSPSRWSVARFVIVGRLETDRNVKLAMEGFALAGLPTATLTVVGDGGARAELEAAAEELGIGERVVFVGWVADVAPYLAEADVFLAPAVEAFGLAALEAMAAGLPVIAVDAGGVAELVEDGRTGLVSAQDPASFAGAMTQLAADPSLASELGTAGRLRAEREFTAERMVERTIAAYRGLAHRSDSGPKILRVYHSGVVPAWRERDRELRRNGADVTLVVPRVWNEGAGLVPLEQGEDDFVVGARTFGRHPALFVYNPLPLWRLMRRHRFDAVDAHEEPYSLAAAEVRLLARCLQPNARFLLYSAQNLAKRYPWPFRAMEARTLAGADALYVVNRAAEEVWRGKGFTAELRLLPLGVDVDRFSPRTEEAAPGHRLVVGYVGRLNAQKGVDVLIRAVAGQDYDVVVAGDGPERSRLEALAAAEGVAVRFLGIVAHDELPDLYRQFDVLVVPSRRAPGVLEQFCRVAVEGMASGVPVVASILGALPEVVGEAGVLVPPDDVDALGGALKSLAADPHERRRLSRLGRDWSRQFSWPEVAAAHLELYEKVLCTSTS